MVGGLLRGLDLHSGFNILKQRILEAVGKPSDLVLSHPPYHNIVVYSGKVWGRVGHPDDLSRCATEDEFLEKLTIALKNQRHATRPGGYYGAIIGDVRRGGVYSSYQADLVARMPKKELAAVLIKGTAQRRQQRQGVPAEAADGSCTSTWSCGRSGARLQWRCWGRQRIKVSFED